MSAIDAYLAELRRTLHGRRRLKNDLLAEARDSLLDAAEDYESDGLGRAAAQERAIDDFGPIARVAPRYQAELGLSQGRHTALLLFFLLGTQHVVYAYTWSSLPDDSPSPGPAYATLAGLVDNAGLVVLCCAIVGALACGIGSRYVRPARLVEAIGLLGLTTVVVWLVAGTVLSAFSPIEQFGANARYLWMHVGSTLLLAAIARSAWQCLRCARHPTQLRGRTIVL